MRLLSQRRWRTFPHGWAFEIRRADHTASEVPHICTATCEGCKGCKGAVQGGGARGRCKGAVQGGGARGRCKGVVQGVQRGGVKGGVRGLCVRAARGRFEGV